MSTLSRWSYCMLGALIMPLEVSAQQPLMCGNLCRTVCSTDWTARACAIETFQASRREKLLSVLAQANNRGAGALQLLQAMSHM